MFHRFFKQYPIRQTFGVLVGYSAGVASAYGLLASSNKTNTATNTVALSFEPKKLKKEYDYLAPDTSEIRLLQTKQHAKSGDMAHCKLPPGSTSIAVKHKTVEEIWYFTHGIGEMWLKEQNGKEHIVNVAQDTALTIPVNASFQFKNTSESEPLEIVITTMPPWPGPEEAIKVQGKWEPSIKKEETQQTSPKP